MSKTFGRWSISLLGAAALLGSIGWQTPAIAGSDNSSDTYAGDYQGGSLPPGTFLFLQYAGYSHADAFFTPFLLNGAKGKSLPGAHATVEEEFSRIVYFTQLFGRPFVIEAELPFATLKDVNLPGTNSQVRGGLVDPVLHFTYFFVADAKAQSWFGFTNYFYLPYGRSYDPAAAINVSTPRQFTDVPQLGWTEGLGKWNPALKGWFFDIIANASFHSNGDRSVVTPGTGPLTGTTLIYNGLTQRDSYNLKGFVRFEPKPLTFIAVGVEKSWGGMQTAVNGGAFVGGTKVFGPLPNLFLGEVDYLRGHIQFQFPLARDFAVAADVFHDFKTEGGYRDNYGVELRLTKFFIPQAPAAPVISK